MENTRSTSVKALLVLLGMCCVAGAMPGCISDMFQDANECFSIVELFLSSSPDPVSSLCSVEGQQKLECMFKYSKDCPELLTVYNIDLGNLEQMCADLGDSGSSTPGGKPGENKVPGKPRITHYADMTSHSFTVYWEPPRETNGILKSYQLQWSDHIVDNTRDIPVVDNSTFLMSAKINGLEPFTEHSLRVRAESGEGYGEYSDPFPVITDVAAPRVPAYLNVTVLSPSSVVVEYRPPQDYFKNIDGYIISYRSDSNDSGNITIKDVAKNKEVITGLPSNTVYKLKMAAYTRSIFSSELTYIGNFTGEVEFTLKDPAESDVGVSLQRGSMIRYEFSESQGLPVTNFTYIRVGFITRRKQGILVQVADETGSQYFSLEMNNNGQVKFFMDFGWERLQLNTDLWDVDLTDGRAHEVIMRQYNLGQKLSLQVDDYESTTTSTGWTSYLINDGIVDNPKYLYIGNNGTARGFEGCIYDVQVDTSFPLAFATQDPIPTNVQITGDMRECSSEDTIPYKYSVPGKPRITHYVDMTSNSFTVYWEPPRVTNGILRSYQLQWSDHIVDNTRDIPVVDNSTFLMSAKIYGLEPYTQYSLRVRAESDAGYGEYSDPFPVITDVAAPRVPAYLNVTVLSPSSVLVEYRPPRDYFKKIDGYIISYRSDSNDSVNITFDDGSVAKTKEVITGLPSNAVYKLKMAAYTQSIFSEKTYIGNFTGEVEFTLKETEKAPETRTTKAPENRATKATTKAPENRATKAPENRATKATTKAPENRATKAPENRATKAPTPKPQKNKKKKLKDLQIEYYTVALRNQVREETVLQQQADLLMQQRETMGKLSDAIDIFVEKFESKD